MEGNGSKLLISLAECVHVAERPEGTRLFGCPTQNLDDLVVAPQSRALEWVMKPTRRVPRLFRAPPPPIRELATTRRRIAPATACSRVRGLLRLTPSSRHDQGSPCRRRIGQPRQCSIPARSKRGDPDRPIVMAEWKSIRPQISRLAMVGRGGDAKR